MDIKYENKDGVINIIAPERIDTTNSADVEASIFGIIEKEGEGLPIIIDCENLQYISSVGLRVILKIKKSQDDLKLINVSSEVYEIFSMTGFAEIIEIQKALREISIEGCPIIGEGYYGKVYRISPDTIVKHYFRGNPVSDIDRERQNAKTAFLLGVPTAISYDVVKVKEGGFGAVYECIDAKSMKNLILEEPQNFDKYLHLVSGLLKQLNHTKVVGATLPKAKEGAYEWVNEITEFFDDKTNAKIKALVDSIPDEEYLVHGDCHVKNIFLLNGEPILIDMDSLTIGHSIFEYNALFQSYVAYEEDEPGNCKRFMGLDYEICEKLFYDSIKIIFDDRTPEQFEDLMAKIKCLSYIHFLAKIIRNHQDTPERKAHTIEKIQKYTETLDTLAY